jgi:hypothetical protein
MGLYRRKCPSCRNTVENELHSDLLERLILELDLIQRRHARFTEDIEHAGKSLDEKQLSNEIQAELDRSIRQKFLKVTKSKSHYLPMLRNLLKNNKCVRKGETAHVRAFPESLYSQRNRKLEAHREIRFVWPWQNQRHRSDIYITVGLFLITAVQLFVFSRTRLRFDQWSWTETIAAGLIYMWTAICFTYSILLLQY